jgi:hypothetical protein
MKRWAGLFVLPLLSVVGCASAPPPAPATAAASTNLDPMWTPPDAWEMQVADKAEAAEVAAPQPKQAVRTHAGDHPNVASKAKSQLFVLSRKSR